MKSALLASGITAGVALTGCASSYTAPKSADAALISVSAPQPTRTPIEVDICTGKHAWERVGIIGQGLGRVGDITFTWEDHPDLAGNASAVRLTDSVAFKVAAGEPVKLRVSSHSELVSGPAYGTGVRTLASCSAVYPLLLGPQGSRDIVFHRSESGCSLLPNMESASSETSESTKVTATQSCN